MRQVGRWPGHCKVCARYRKPLSPLVNIALHPVARGARVEGT